MPRRFLVTLAIAGIALCYTIQTHAQRLLTFSSLEFFGSTDPISPQSAIAALAQWVSSLNLAQGMQNSLDSKLSNAQAALESVKGGDASTGCNKLDSFINAVHAQQDKGQLSNTAARELTNEAELIKSALDYQ